MNMKTNHWISAGLLLLTPITEVTAQELSASDIPSSVRQDHLRRLEQTAPPRSTRPAAEVETQRSVAPASAVALSFSEILFSASELLSPEELQAIGQPYLGRSLKTSDIQLLLDDISALYSKRGVLTAIPVLPQQNLQSGVLRILLVEGRLGRVIARTAGNEDPKWVERWFDLPAGAVVTNDALSKKIALFNSTSDMYATAEFVAGEQFGMSDLTIDIAENPRTQLWSFVEASGRSNAVSNLYAVGWRIAPAGPWGGRFDAALLHAEEGETLVGGGSWPVGTRGWRMGMSISKSRTKSSENDANLMVKGDSTAAVFDIGTTWILNSAWTLGTALSWSTSRSTVAVEDFNLPTNYLNKAALTALLNYENRQTKATIKITPASVSDRNQRVSYIDTSTQFQAALNSEASWNVRFNGLARWKTGDKANSIDLLALGGTETVRGFDPGTIRGENAAALQLELGYKPIISDTQSGEMYIFVDHGKNSRSGVSEHISSFGIGLKARIAHNLGIEAVRTHALNVTADQRNRWLVRLIGSW